MSDVFKRFPKFIETDPRINRTEIYTVTEDFMTKRLTCFFKGINLKDKTVLDLGCNVGAVGAWVLDLGAKFYCGIDANEEVTETAKNNLKNTFDNSRWNIAKEFAEDTLEKCETFDIIVASGVVYCFFDPIPIIKKMSEKCDILIIESMEPFFNLSTNAIRQLLAKANFFENMPLITFRKQPVSWGTGKNVVFNGSNPSSGFFKHYLEVLGFDIVNINDDLRRDLPNVYSKEGRFALQFIKNTNKAKLSEGLYNGIINNSPDIGYKEWKTNGDSTKQ